MSSYLLRVVNNVMDSINRCSSNEYTINPGVYRRKIGYTAHQVRTRGNAASEGNTEEYWEILCIRIVNCLKYSLLLANGIRRLGHFRFVRFGSTARLRQFKASVISGIRHPSKHSEMNDEKTHDGRS